MNKLEFLSALRKNLAGMPEEDIEKSLDYYEEMIEDRMEDAMTEQEAVLAIGSPEEVAAGILMDMPLPKLVRAKAKPQRKFRTWEIVLLILGSPVWASLLLAAISVILALYLVLWSAIATLYIFDLSAAAVSVCGILGFAVFLFRGYVMQAILLLGGGLVCGGFAILLFVGSGKIAGAAVILSKQILVGIKTWVIGRGEKK